MLVEGGRVGRNNTSARSLGMSGGTHLAFVVDSHFFGCVLIVYFINDLNLSIVVPCTKSPKL